MNEQQSEQLKVLERLRKEAKEEQGIASDALGKASWEKQKADTKVEALEAAISLLKKEHK